VDDDERVVAVVSRGLQREGFDVDSAPDGDQALAALASRPYDAVLMDVYMPGRTGIDTLKAIREQGHAAPVVIMSGSATIDLAVAAVREGAVDFIEKPLRAERVALTLANALRYSRLRSRAEILEAEAATDKAIIGRSAPMQRLRRMIAKAAPSEGRVLITGENGTGKELVARAIHAESARSGSAFVKLNCAAVPSELIESELFGHEKGAFTGASSARPGRFELAHRGTLFLDEVGDMPGLMQAKLLRVLQEGEYERVGSSHARLVDTRVLAATNQDLAGLVDRGKFREDLYYRINVVAIEVPPLRERGEDIDTLVESFIREFTRRNNRRPMTVDDAGLAALRRHDFPGNVRELRNVIERLVILAEGPVISETDVELALGRRGHAGATAATPLYCPGSSFKDLIAASERAIVEQALAHHDGNVTETAASLGLERSHLHKKMRALGVARPNRVNRN
jgi:DNA-binding NtrC family response regulator